MIRTPLRPLARILQARAQGENPDAIERENIRLRHEEMRDRARVGFALGHPAEGLMCRDRAQDRLPLHVVQGRSHQR